MKYILLFFPLFVIVAHTVQFQDKINPPKIGIVHEFKNDRLFKEQGFHNLVESTQKIFSPHNVTEEQSKNSVPKLKKMQIPLFGSNLFIPGNLKIVGPEVDEKALLSYVKVVFQRGKAAGIKMIIWGSGGSRQIPEGFDPNKAREQFISMAKKMAALAEKYDIILAVENLNSTEGNHINTVAEALEIVKAVNHKNFRLCADIYHMLKEGESPEVITTTKGYLVYCEIAEKEGRTPPGVNGEDFRPFLAALKKIGYEGNIMLECRWENIEDQGAKAVQYLQNQIKEVYNN